MSGYSLRQTQQQIRRNIEEEISSGQIPASFAATAEHEARSLGSATNDFYFDSAGLMRRQTVVVGGGTSGVHGHLNVTYTHFGAPISIAVPPQSDILSFSGFLKAASNLSNSQ